MRIVPDDALFPTTEDIHGNEVDTIEITDDEWDTIGVEYQGHSNMYAETSDWMPFSKYLKELISLRAK